MLGDDIHSYEGSVHWLHSHVNIHLGETTLFKGKASPKNLQSISDMITSNFLPRNQNRVSIWHFLDPSSIKSFRGLS